METCGCIIGILIFLFVLYCFLCNIIRLFYWLKCFKTKECTSENCLMKNYCDKRGEVYTEEDQLAIEKILEEWEQDKSIIYKELIRYEGNYWKVIDGILYVMVCLAALSFIGTVVWIVVMGIDIIFR